ncbi:ABC transporter substrate-binding protein [Kutzneria buriramensis]|uniref:Peptide/nickel transport system substrate-binding protein n=1 Tax=Kutzneria buriramensis TaxID=1045776 RepID=A0A3E0HHI3_9PSEU|nr:ABC transporter substrate-binding protein [Kutzneria buriramensis]REH45897.1 peptide/nickel transport system substrate-binding protein [Kutzneria buriramensis]
MTVSRRAVLRAGALLGVGALAAGCADDQDTRSVSAAALGPSKHGGVLRVGITGGSAADGLDPHHPPTYTDQARVSNLYEPLFVHDVAYNILPVLAESIEPSDHGRTWTLRLRDGVEFHNGKRLDVDDVIFTFHRIIGTSANNGAAALSIIDLAGLRRLDARTLRIPLTQPYALFQDELAQYYNAVVPVGFDPAKPVGTGPFRLGAFTPGDRSSFPRFTGYWRGDQPYVDELVIIDFADDEAQLEALLRGEVEAIDNLAPERIATVKAAGGNVLVSETGNWTPFTMRVDTPPLADPRVRQALRLVVDREQMVSQALNGQGRIGNDLYAPFDVCYAKQLPQRQQDLDQARSLLRSAGHPGLQLEIVTSDAIDAAAVAAARLFADQAAGAGIDVRVRVVDSGVFYGNDYLSWDFAQDYWYTRSYLPQVGQGSLPNAPYNECHWNDPTFNSLIASARAELDSARRNRLLQDAQQLEYDHGGYVVWGFKNQVDAYTNKVTGFIPDRGLPLSSFQFRTVSFV